MGDDADDYAQLPSSNDNDKDVDVEYVGDDADDYARHSCPPPMSIIISIIIIIIINYNLPMMKMMPMTMTMHSCPPPMSMPRRRTSLRSPHALTLCSTCLHISKSKVKLVSNYLIYKYFNLKRSSPRKMRENGQNLHSPHADSLFILSQQIHQNGSSVQISYSKTI